MNKYNSLFKNKKFIACFIAAALGSGLASAQVKRAKDFPAQNTISTFDNTTFCVAYLSGGNLLTIRDRPVTIYNKLSQLATGIMTMGISGAGKTILGKLVANKLGYTFVNNIFGERYRNSFL